MNYKTKEKVNLTVGYIGMIIVVMAWIYPVFFLIVNANKTASQYSKGDKTEIIFGTAFIDNAIKAWNKIDGSNRYRIPLDQHLAQVNQ